MTLFEPTLQAAQARLAAIDPAAYARTRNALEGAVSRLSPYLTHGMLSLREVYEALHARHRLDAKHKFVFELGWRAYWHHVWTHRGDGIHQSLHGGLLPDDAYHSELPADVLQARTGIPAIDLAVRELYETGYLHNHARMWLASYLVHLRKVHWHTGAQWMLGHLLDGDVASNHLSWQWVAGTGSSKPYLFNAQNVAKYAPQPWHSFGTAMDTSYEALDRIAGQPNAIHLRQDSERAGPGMATPAVHASPPQSCGPWTAPDADLATGRDVWLVHPWSLNPWSLDPLAPDTDRQTLIIAVAFPACHAPMPWSARRWQFVTGGLQALTPHTWWANAAHIAEALAGARSVVFQPELQMRADWAAMQAHWRSSGKKPVITERQQPELFAQVETPCSSFSDWWRRTDIAN